MKPWDKFDTPVTNMTLINSGGLWSVPIKLKMEEMEKRLELCERLLDDYLSRDENNDYLTEEAQKYFDAVFSKKTEPPG